MRKLRVEKQSKPRSLAAKVSRNYTARDIEALKAGYWNLGLVIARLSEGSAIDKFQEPFVSVAMRLLEKSLKAELVPNADLESAGNHFDELVTELGNQLKLVHSKKATATNRTKLRSAVASLMRFIERLGGVWDGRVEKRLLGNAGNEESREGFTRLALDMISPLVPMPYKKTCNRTSFEYRKKTNRKNPGLVDTSQFERETTILRNLLDIK